MSLEWNNQLAWENWREKIDDDRDLSNEKLWEFLVMDDDRCWEFLDWLFEKKLGVVEEYINTRMHKRYENFLQDEFYNETQGPEHDNEKRHG